MPIDLLPDLPNQDPNQIVWDVDGNFRRQNNVLDPEGRSLYSGSGYDQGSQADMQYQAGVANNLWNSSGRDSSQIGNLLNQNSIQNAVRNGFTNAGDWPSINGNDWRDFSHPENIPQSAWDSLGKLYSGGNQSPNPNIIHNNNTNMGLQPAPKMPTATPNVNTGFNGGPQAGPNYGMPLNNGTGQYLSANASWNNMINNISPDSKLNSSLRSDNGATGEVMANQEISAGSPKGANGPIINSDTGIGMLGHIGSDSTSTGLLGASLSSAALAATTPAPSVPEVVAVPQFDMGTAVGGDMGYSGGGDVGSSVGSDIAAGGDIGGGYI